MSHADGVWRATVMNMADSELTGLLLDLRLAEAELGGRTAEEAARGRAVIAAIRETAERELRLRRRAGAKELDTQGLRREQTRRLRQAIRERVDLVSLVSEDVELRRSGNSWRGRCPFHDDREPSLVVWPQSGRWRCFGCGLGGDAVAWVMAMRKFDFREALVYCAMRAGLPAAAAVVWPNEGKGGRR